MIRTTSETALWIDNLLLDLNQVKYWYESKVWPSHSPAYAMAHLQILISNFHNGVDISLTRLYDHILTLNYMGWYTEDELYVYCPYPVYRYLPTNKSNWANSVRVNGYNADYEIPRDARVVGLNKPYNIFTNPTFKDYLISDIKELK